MRQFQHNYVLGINICRSYTGLLKVIWCARLCYISTIFSVSSSHTMRSSYSTTSSTTRVGADFPLPERQTLCEPKPTTQRLHTSTSTRYAVSTVGNSVPCRRTNTTARCSRHFKERSIESYEDKTQYTRVKKLSVLYPW